MSYIKTTIRLNKIQQKSDRPDFRGLNKDETKYIKGLLWIQELENQENRFWRDIRRNEKSVPIWSDSDCKVYPLIDKPLQKYRKQRNKLIEKNSWSEQDEYLIYKKSVRSSSQSF
jgi:hypothetical protein